MNWEELSALSTFGTLLVIAATAIAAVVQLRHMRSGNTISAVLGFMDKWATPDWRQRANYVFGGELDARLQDPVYRKGLMQPWVDRIAYPEVPLLDFWEQMAMMIKMGYSPEEAFMETGGSLSILAWKKLMPVIAIMRRARGSELYDNFEWLVARAIRWEEQHAGGTYPGDTPHMPTRDPFPEDVRSQ